MKSFQPKWAVYALTFATYAAFHSIRSAWAGLKVMFFAPPFNYSVDFLGLMDMIVLFTMALTLSTFGHRVEHYGAKKCLIIGMTLLTILTLMIGVLLLNDITSQAMYIFLFGIGVGVLSATGWPSCLYLLSQYFDKKNNIALPIWNGTSQVGDFFALFISDIIIQGFSADVSITLIIIPVFMAVTVILNKIYLPEDKKKQQTPRDLNELNEQKNEEKSQSDKKQDKSLQNKLPTKQNPLVVNLQVKDELQIKHETISDNDAQKQSSKDQSIRQTPSKLSQVVLQISQPDRRPVNFSNVWCLPGVALYVTAYSIIKSINSIIMTWLVFYLSLPDVDMKEQSRVIAILWAFGVFGGGIIGGKVNSDYSKWKFIICLTISAFMFLTLERMHQKVYEIQIAIAIVICSLAYGIPYNMLSTAVPIMLSQNQQIKSRPGAKSAIISLMQGFGLGACAFSILLVPLVGVNDIHVVLIIYCLSGIFILTFASIFQRTSKNVATESTTQRQQHDQRC